MLISGWGWSRGQGFGRIQHSSASAVRQFPGGACRAVEDIKARYYTVARQLLTGRDGGAEGVGNQAIIKHPYNPEHERCAARSARSRSALLVLLSTPSGHMTSANADGTSLSACNVHEPPLLPDV